jgi:ABC-type antimicrobial peptide transport system permease subunit
LGEEDRAAIYEPYLQREGNRTNLSFLIRTHARPSDFSRAIGQTLSGVDPNAAVEVKPMNQAMGMALLPSRAGAGLLGVIGVLGLTLAAIGLFGVLSYSVSRRSREIGLRMALGARPADILGMVAGEGAWIVGSGLAVGMFASMFVTKPLALFLVSGLEPSDPVTYFVVAGVLLLVACVASLKPAVRALRADPSVALRLE